MLSLNMPYLVQFRISKTPMRVPVDTMTHEKYIEGQIKGAKNET